MGHCRDNGVNGEQFPNVPLVSKGRRQKKNTSYSVTFSLKVGGGQDEIILLGAAKKVTRWLRWGGTEISLSPFPMLLLAVF